MALAITAGLIVERLINRVMHSWQTGGHEKQSDSPATTLGFLLHPSFIDILGLIAFVIVMVSVTRFMLCGSEFEIGRHFLTVLVFCLGSGRHFPALSLRPTSLKCGS